MVKGLKKRSCLCLIQQISPKKVKNIGNDPMTYYFSRIG